MRARKPKEPPPPESLVLSTLRKARGWTGQDLADASGTSAQMISVYEAGRRPPSRGRLVALAAAMGYGTEAIDLVLLALKGAAGGAELPRAPVDPAPGELRDIRTVAARVGVAAVDLTERSLVRLLRARRARKARRQAARLWAGLRNETAANRRLLVEKAREFQTWALSERLCHASEEAASDRADFALELAGLACRVAELAPGEEAWRSRLQGYALAYLANARRVANDLTGAEEAFAQAWKLWQAGAEADPGLLAEWRLLDREASLHRGRRRFREALDFFEGAGEILQPQLQAVEQLLQRLQGGSLPPRHVAAQHGRRDPGRMGNVLEGPAIPDAEGSQGLGQTIESAHGLEFIPALSVWQQPACRFPLENP